MHTLHFYLFRQGNDEPLARMAANTALEVVAAGCQHGAVRAEAAALYRHRQITQCIAPPLLVEAAQDMGAVHRGLEREAGGARDL